MKLYYIPGSCSLAPHMALNEIGASFTLDRVQMSDKKTCSEGDYFAINPKGNVPALKTDDGKTLTECALLLQFIADQNPGKHLIPAPGSFERYKCQEWLNFIATDLHKGCIPYWASDSWTSMKGAAAEVREKIQGNIKKQLNYVCVTLEKNEFLLGSRYSVADIYLFNFLFWLPELNLDIAQWPTLKNYFQKIKDRPEVQKTLRTEGLQ